VGNMTYITIEDWAEEQEQYCSDVPADVINRELDAEGDD